ncbi:hypothetical protein MKW98_027933 [Papaver atlanticum]|uniref:F-box protein n=1 Tax=Papaver atlanticum TaxID=357466 RepID=A0AAD4SAP7_9MAGN|nr:hypothetical protein MKW98_027933 [Papaver atlanticum]
MAPELRDQRGIRKLPPSPKVAPWLVYQHGKDRKFQTFYNLCEPLSNKSRNKNNIIPELSNRSFWHKNSNRGWLVVVCDDDTETKEIYGNCYLWNPGSLEIIMLPNILRSLHQDSFFVSHYVRDCVLSFGGTGEGVEGSSSSCCTSHSSSSFGSDANSNDWMDYILLNEDAQENANPDILLYCHPGDREWRKHEFVDAPHTLLSMLYCNGKLYVMCSEGNIHLEIETHHPNDAEKEEILCVSDSIWAEDNFERESVAGLLEWGNVEQSWMESIGEVFLSLEDYVFFLSEYQQLSCLASDLGFSKNCVCYTQDMDMGLYTYTLEDNSILLSVPCPDISSPWLPAGWLMINTTQRATEYKDNVAKDDEEKEDTGEVQSCVMLYDDIVRLISDYLHPVDYIHLRAVCKNYRSLIILRRSYSTRTLKTTDTSPWLFFPNYDQAVYNFINPMHNNESYLMNIPESFQGSRIRFSKGGWLLMSKGKKTLFFYNPFTKSTVKLPDLSDDHCFNFSGISFSSLPTSSDCIVFGISQLAGSDVRTFFIKRGDDRWTNDSFVCSYLPNRKMKQFEADFNNPVFYRGDYYCLDNNGSLGVSTIEHGISWEILANVIPPKCEFIYKTFLVECEGKLLSVLLGHLGKWVRIFRLNDEDTDLVWVEVKHLGRHMLCISNTSCISAIAPTGQMENKIYFPRLHNEGILFYSLDTGMYHSVGSEHSAKDYRDSREKLNCSWIEPNWSEISDHYRHWFNI